MAGNKRNLRTTHPLKAARRERAADRFKFDSDYAKKDAAYRTAKTVEAASLGVDIS